MLSRLRSHAVVVPVLAVALLTVLAGCDRQSGAASPPVPPPPTVRVSQPVPREVTETDEYTGRLEAAETVEVRARVSGFIDSAPFEEGSVVRAGDLLFEIDARPFQAEADRAAAEVSRAQAQLARDASELKRLESIRGGAVNEKEIQDARYNKAASESALAAAWAAMESARLNVQFTRVTAPIGGRISRKYVTPGNLITAGGTGGSGTLLTTITSLDPIYAYIEADERAVLKYQRLNREKKRESARETRIPAFMALADEHDFRHEGYIDFVDNRLDPATGTLRARASFSNADGFFTPGLFARLRIPGSSPYPGLLVADEAIGSDQAERFVLTVAPDNTVQRRPVKVGVAFDGLRVVEGVKPDEWVVVNGLMRARPGMKVNPQQAPMPTRARAGGTISRPSTRPATRPSTNPVAAVGLGVAP